MARDHWNREIGDVSANDLGQQMRGSVRRVMETKSPRTDAAIESLKDIIETLSAKIDKNSKEQEAKDKQWAKILINFDKNFKKGWVDNRKDDRRSESQLKQVNKMSEAMQNLWHASQSQHTIWVGISKLSERAQRDIADAIRMSGCCGAASARAANQVAAKNSGSVSRKVNYGSGASKAGSAAAAGTVEDAAGGKMPGLANTLLMGTLKTFHAGLMMSVGVVGNALNKTVESLEIDPKKIIFSKTGEVQKFIENMRMMTHETEGYVELNGKVEKDIRNLEREIYASGRTAEENYKVFQKNYERGQKMIRGTGQSFIKDLKSVKSIQTSALSTANFLHMNVDEINELFMDWHMHLNLSSMELAEMGRHMKDIARSTGVTGAQLEKSMKNSEGIIKMLKKFGVASPAAMKNVTKIMALAEKYGVGEKAAEILQGTTSRSSFLNMDAGLRNFLAQAAQSKAAGPETFEKLQLGLLPKDKTGYKDLFAGMEQLTKEMFATVGENNVDVANISKTIQKMQSEGRGMEAATLQRKFSEIWHIDFGDLEQLAQAMKEFGKTAYDNVAALKDAMNATKHVGEKEELRRKFLEANTNLSMDAFGRLQEFSEELKKSGGIIPEDLKIKMAKSMEDIMPADVATKFSGSLKEESFNLLNQMAERASKVGLNMDDILKAHGLTTATAKHGLETGEKDVLESVTKMMQEIDKKELRSSDPASKFRDDMNDWHSTWSITVGQQYANMVYKDIQAVAVANELWGWLETIVTTLITIAAAQSLISFLTKFMPSISGAAGAAGAAGTAAGAAKGAGIGAGAAGAASTAAKGGWWARLGGSLSKAAGIAGGIGTAAEVGINAYGGAKEYEAANKSPIAGAAKGAMSFKDVLGNPIVTPLTPLKIATEAIEGARTGQKGADTVKGVNSKGVEVDAGAFKGFVSSGAKSVKESIPFLPGFAKNYLDKLIDSTTKTADVMEQGETKGSIYVHDTHVEEALKNSLATKKSGKGSDLVSMLSLGLFDSETVGNAMEQTIQNMAGKDLNNIMTSVVSKESQNKIKNIVVEVSKALDYEKSASEAATTKDVQTLMLNRQNIEETVERRKYGTSGSLASTSNMDSVYDYLSTDQKQILLLMVEHLASIKENTKQQSSSSIIGKAISGVASMQGPGIKNIARDITRGFWDLTYGDYSPGSVTTDGRGGSG